MTAAGQITKTLTYTCGFPDPVGNQDVTGTLKTTIPDTGKVGQRMSIKDTTVSGTFNATIANWVRGNGAVKVGGNGRADVRAEFNGIRLVLGIPGKTVPIDVPPGTGEISGTIIAPEVPDITVREPGTIAVSAGQEINVKVDQYAADGSVIRTDNIRCTVKPGQDLGVGSVTITA